MQAILEPVPFNHEDGDSMFLRNVLIRLYSVSLCHSQEGIQSECHCVPLVI
jgi:hypothetical protein